MLSLFRRLQILGILFVFVSHAEKSLPSDPEQKLKIAISMARTFVNNALEKVPALSDIDALRKKFPQLKNDSYTMRSLERVAEYLNSENYWFHVAQDDFMNCATGAKAFYVPNADRFYYCMNGMNEPLIDIADNIVHEFTHKAQWAMNIYSKGLKFRECMASYAQVIATTSMGYLISMNDYDVLEGFECAQHKIANAIFERMQKSAHRVGDALHILVDEAFYQKFSKEEQIQFNFKRDLHEPGDGQYDLTLFCRIQKDPQNKEEPTEFEAKLVEVHGGGGNFCGMIFEIPKSPFKNLKCYTNNLCFTPASYFNEAAKGLLKIKDIKNVPM